MRGDVVRRVQAPAVSIAGHGAAGQD